ncbi:septal ring lytic transglycosylase RlpA family protein [Hydrogenobacter thermophilus]|uniref:septal ring lytic transglycosylase RlpA family protein n=1 Tax=Hydrogenobacter thermophilus TaxID=940 RepID=UPI0030F8B071
MRTVILLFMLFSMVLAKGECEEVEGYASWYGREFHGKKTASGEAFNKYKYTAASKIFPINTYVLVKNLENGEEVVVRITDKGPFVKSRILDLSKASAEKLGILEKGIVKVKAIPLYCVADADKSDEDEYIKDIIKTF